MRYAAALSYLNQIQGETGKLSLENIRRVIERAPFARCGARYVQVAGTNGKGSTSHFIAAILQAAGWRVGLFTSPHLQDVRERIRLDGRADLARRVRPRRQRRPRPVGAAAGRRRDRQPAHFFRDRCSWPPSIISPGAGRIGWCWKWAWADAWMPPAR